MIDFGLGIQLHSLNENSDLAQWRNDPKIWRWTRQNDLISHASQKIWFEAQEKDESIQMYGIWVPQGGDGDKPWHRLVGVCGLTSIDWQNRKAELSLYIAPAWQGRRLSRPALLTLLFHGFKNMGLNMIFGEALEGNPAARIFAKVGMCNTGFMPESYWKDGCFLDSQFYCITADEFELKNGDGSCFGSASPAASPAQ